MRSRAMVRVGCVAMQLIVAVAGVRAQTVAVPPGAWQVYVGAGCALSGAMPCKLGPQYLELLIAPEYWQRAEIELPAELRGSPQLGILMGRALLYRVYVNGQEVGGSGDYARQRGPLDGREIFPIPAGLAGTGHLVLALKLLDMPTPDEDGPGPPVRVGTLQALATQRPVDTLDYLHAVWLHFLCYLLVFCAGGFFLLLYLMQRQSREYLWLGLLFVGVGALRVGEFAMVVDLGAGVLAGGINSLFWNSLFLVWEVEFVFAFLRRPVPRPWRLVEVFVVVSILPSFVLLLPISHASFERLTAPALGAAIPEAFALPLFALVWLVPLRECWRSRDAEMRWIGGALTFLGIEEISRYSGQVGLPSLPQDVFMRGVDVDLRAISFLLFSLVMIVSMTVRYRRMQGRNNAMEAEMAAARTVQQVLIPDFLPSVPGLTVESAYYPAQEVGGDFFQVLPLQAGAAFVVLGDVSGKGLQAAMTVALIVGTLRTYAEYCTSPAELLVGLNRRLYGRDAGFATCLALKFEPSGIVTIANAAHCNPYLDGVEMETESSLPLGIEAEIAIMETSLELTAGPRLTLVTDGVIEATDAKTRELFGFARTAAISGERAQAIADAARTFGMGTAQADDITVLTLVRA